MQKLQKQNSNIHYDHGSNAGKYYDWYMLSTPKHEHEGYLKTYQPNVEDFLSYVPKGSHVIDLGCGLGQTVHRFFTHGLQVYGIDASPVTVQSAKNYFPYLDIRHGNLEDFQKEAPLWGVYERLALLYMPKQRLKRLFKKIYDELEPGGVFQTTFEEDAGQESGWYPYETEEVVRLHNGLVRQATVPVCITYLTKEQLSELLMDSGFDLRQIYLHQEPKTTHRNLITALAQKIS